MNKSLFGTAASAERQARASHPFPPPLPSDVRSSDPALFWPVRVRLELCSAPQSLQDGHNPNTAPLSSSQWLLSEVFSKLLLSTQFP